ncbi:hypothetical protein GPK34_00060 [Secundilactobacillus kimchicus]|uniref:hypothetical protein n=1 Tax=Secundilactobacillus kimchicus TaxID=528209 RepID=UPI001C00F2D8|nr:hypothetical protein [Secundilactobacillus kimchicus]MBT9670429.1 hypothetical protein [Secundilactobacillus kimchicus]
MEEKIISIGHGMPIISKRTGVNQFLFEADESDFLPVLRLIEDKFKIEKDYAYVIFESREIKLF